MRSRAVTFLLFACIALGPCAVSETARADEALTFDRFAALVRTYSEVLTNGREATSEDEAAWREIVLHPTVTTAGFAQRIALDSQRSLDERVVATITTAKLPEAARVTFATPIVEAAAQGRLPMDHCRYGHYSLLEAALFPTIEASPAFQSPSSQGLLAKARRVDGIDPRLAWTIDAARGAPHPLPDDAAFGRLLEAIAQIAPKLERRDLTRLVAFRDIARDPLPYRDLALGAVRNRTLSIDARTAAVLAMQRLPDEAYFTFLDAVVQGTLDGTVPKTPGKLLHTDKSIMAAALFPQPPYVRVNKLFGRDPRAFALVSKAKRADDPTAFELEIAARSQALLAGGPSYAAYVEMLKPIAKGLVNAEWYDGIVFGGRDFLPLFEYPEPYRDLAERAMRDPGVDLDGRIIAALTIQSLPQDMLLDVLDRLVGDAAAGRLDMHRGKIEPDTILEAALFPHLNFNAYLHLAADTLRVRRLLNAAEAVDGLTPRLKTQIANALAGTTRAQLLDNYSAYEPIPRLDYVLDGNDASIEAGPRR